MRQPSQAQHNSESRYHDWTIESGLTSGPVDPDAQEGCAAPMHPRVDPNVLATEHPLLAASDPAESVLQLELG